MEQADRVIKQNMIMEKILFEHIEHLGEMENDDFQIIDISDSVDEFSGEKKFKVYHSEGYCFDISKIVAEDAKFDYFLYDEWDGFRKGSVTLYCKLLS